MIAFAFIFAALIHVYIFLLESFWWARESTRKTFGTTGETSEVTKSLAFNQGFYNLFLALMFAIGICLYAYRQHVAGITLLGAGAGSMFLASLVLILSDRSKARAALVQGTAPLLALLCLVIVIV